MSTDTWRAPNIYQTPYGWRVYVRGRDPDTHKSKLTPHRFKQTDPRLACRCATPRPACERCALAALARFRDTHKAEVQRKRLEGRATRQPAPSAELFPADAAAYLALETVKAMPSYEDRVFQIHTWGAIFTDRVRRTITAPEIDNELQKLRNAGYSGSTVNKFRTALMSLWTRLDGRSAANPVKDTAVFEETALEARGQAYDLLEQILALIPETRGRRLERPALYRDVWRTPLTAAAARYDVSASYLGRVCRQLDVPLPPHGYWLQPARERPPRPPLPASTQTGRLPTANESRARLEVLAWTGMDPSQLARMGPDHVSIAQQWYITPQRQKGARRRRTPRAVVKKPMGPEMVKAFQRVIDLQCWGPFDVRALLRLWVRATKRLERRLQEEYGDPDFRLPHIKLKDLRHSFGTKLYEETGDLELVRRYLDQAPGSPMANRYTLGALPSVLRRHVGKLPRRRARRAKVRA